MKPEEKKEIVSLYESRLKSLGITPQTMGWKDREQQRLRFRILTEIGIKSNCSVLDIGCGFADYYTYLSQRGIQVSYTGYDLSKKIIGAAKKLHSNLNLQVKDILREKPRKKFDFVVESGILNKSIYNNMVYARNIIKKMFDICRIGISVNMMSNYVDYEEDYLYYYRPEEMFKFCRSLSKWVVLRHDYPLYEFTLYVYRKGVEDETR